jgi:hypothetical protein
MPPTLITKQLVEKIKGRALTEFKSGHRAEYESDQQSIVAILLAANALLKLGLVFEERQIIESVDDL